MPNLTVTKNYQDNTTLTQAQLDTAFTSIETFVNTTKLDSTNIQSAGISSDNLAPSSVTTAKVAAEAINYAKLASDITAKLVPVGAVLPFAGTSAPTGFLLCDGTAVNRTTYAALFAVISTYHGSGDGATTFNLPDYRGRFLRGVDGGAAHDPDRASRTAMNSGGNTGDNVGSVQGSQFGSHGHGNPTFAASGHKHLLPVGFDIGSIYTQADGGGNPVYGSQVSNVSGNSISAVNTTDNKRLGYSNTPDSTSSVANDGGNETRPVNAGVHFIIRY